MHVVTHTKRSLRNEVWICHSNSPDHYWDVPSVYINPHGNSFSLFARTCEDSGQSNVVCESQRHVCMCVFVLMVMHALEYMCV